MYGERSFMAKITILGSGSWGTALAHSLCAKGHEVYLWSRKEETTLALTEKKKMNAIFPVLALQAFVLRVI